MTDNESVYKQLVKHKEQGDNILTPDIVIAGLTEFHRPVIESSTFSADPEKGDVYAHDDAKPGPHKKWRPRRQMYMKIAGNAGVIWSPSESHRMDDGKNRDYICYRSVGGIVKADGTPYFIPCDYDMDFMIIEEELAANYEKKARYLEKDDKGKKRRYTDEEKKEYIEYCVNRDMRQTRKNSLRLCQSGAMGRVVRALLGLNQTYTTEELTKPFVTVRIVNALDYNNTKVREAVTSAAIQAITGIYGPKAIEHYMQQSKPIDITPINTAPPENGNGENGKDDPPLPPTIADLAVDFENSAVDEQEKVLWALQKKTGYDLDDYLKRAGVPFVSKLSQEQRSKMFKHLMTLPAKPADDIPL